MIANDKQFLHAWIIEKLQESNENNFVELLEIKKKYNSDAMWYSETGNNSA
jgi:hypothetical protein